MAGSPEVGRSRRGRNNKEDDKRLVQGLFSEKLKGLRFVRTTEPNRAGSPRTAFLTPPRTRGGGAPGAATSRSLFGRDPPPPTPDPLFSAPRRWGSPGDPGGFPQAAALVRVPRRAPLPGQPPRGHRSFRGRRTLTVGTVLQAAVDAAARVQLEVVLRGAVELAAPGRPAEVLVDAAAAARIPPRPRHGARGRPAGLQQAEQQQPDQVHRGIAPASRRRLQASAAPMEGTASRAGARCSEPAPAPGGADSGSAERGRGGEGRGGERWVRGRERETERERDPLIFTPKRVRFPLLRKELKEKTVRQQKADAVPRQRRGRRARGGRPGGVESRGRARRPGRVPPALARPPRAAVEPWLCSAARPAPVRPPGSERSLPRPLPRPLPQTNYASENYRPRSRGGRPRPCHPLPPLVNPLAQWERRR